MKFNELVPKTWGYEKVIVNGDMYCGKILHFVKGHSCSMHYHKKKTETFYISYGEILVHHMFDPNIMRGHLANGEDHMFSQCQQHILKAGDCFHIPPGLVHKMTAQTDAEIIEFSTTDFQDDSYRLIQGQLQ